MLQRIQTVWLFLAGLAALLTLRFPYYSGTKDPAITYTELNGSNGGLLILIITVFVGVIALVTIGLYKNRTMQLRLCIAGILLEAILIFLYYRLVSTYITGTYALTSILHMCVLLFFGLAARNINKDEKLIKESNRLR